MTQADLEVLAGFGAVWERVSGERMDSPNDPSISWKDLLQAAYTHWQGCMSLGGCAVGSCQKQLVCLAREAKRLFDGLHTEYYLDTGDVYVTEHVCRFASYAPYNLRKLCKNAVKLAELLQKYGEAECLPVRDAEKAVVRHERILKTLLMQCLQ